MPMDFNVVTLEVADLIVHFDYYDRLVSEVVSKAGDFSDEQAKIRNKSKEHLSLFFAGTEFYNSKKQLKPLTETKGAIIAKLADMKTKDVHDLIEKLEKDAKKIKKLYLALTKK
jgi:predicted transcriptional regulator